MGYETYHNLSIDSEISEEKKLEIINVLRGENEEAEWAIDENGYAQMGAKWYDLDEHMKEFSKKYPDVLFVMDGEGEDNGDLWKAYFKNGKMQLCSAEIVYPDYDETKLA